MNASLMHGLHALRIVLIIHSVIMIRGCISRVVSHLRVVTRELTAWRNILDVLMTACKLALSFAFQRKDMTWQ